MPPKKKSKTTGKSECTDQIDDEPQDSNANVDKTTGPHQQHHHRKTAARPTKKNAKMSTTTSIKSASSDNDKKSHEKANKVQQYWLMKAEPESRIENGVDVKFGVDDLMKEPNQTACWDGVRNYQARNFMRDQMSVGDLAFFYHRYVSQAQETTCMWPEYGICATDRNFKGLFEIRKQKKFLASRRS